MFTKLLFYFFSQYQIKEKKTSKYRVSCL